MKTTNKLFRIFFLIICVFGLSKTCCWGQSKYSQYNYEPKVRTFIFTYGLILSEKGYPSHLTDYRHSLKTFGI